MSQHYDDRTALVVVDVQNDFADPDGGLYVAEGEQVVPAVNAEIEAARAAGALVVYTQDWHPASTPHFAKDGGVWPTHCVQDTWGAELHPQLDVDGPVVRKGVDGGDGYSGFSVRDPVSGQESATELGRILDDAGIRRVVVTGLAGDVCVKATALDARNLGYDVTLPLATTRFVELEPGDGDRAVSELRGADVEVVPG
ncbi:MAG TPA: isochorismatase family protein [Egicoccus sp.]|nr:isochorismatase family protein [Egicoccus sp.]HSK21828.1 isochorismatase family protein [Egicoccus sp.]